jgi:hypothetical protein
MTVNARRIENLEDSIVSAEKVLRVQPKLDFEFVEIPRCSPRTLQEINEFLDAQDTSHPFQWPEWSEGEAFFGFLRCEGRIRWVAQCGSLFPAGQFLRSIRALTVSRGPVCDDLAMLETGLQYLVAETRKRKIAFIEIMPEWTGAFGESVADVLARNGWQSLSGARSSLRLALSPSTEELLASFRKTTRYEIRRSMSEGVEVAVANSESEYREFLRLYYEMASERKFPAEEAGFLMGVFRWLHSEQGRGNLFLAREGGALRGGILAVRSGARCWYLLGATSKDGSTGVGHLLQWQAIQWAKENGCVEYDFGGYREGASSGPALFKKGFCDRVVHFLSPYRYVVTQSRHRASEAFAVINRARRSLWQ